MKKKEIEGIPFQAALGKKNGYEVAVYASVNSDGPYLLVDVSADGEKLFRSVTQKKDYGAYIYNYRAFSRNGYYHCPLKNGWCTNSFESLISNNIKKVKIPEAQAEQMKEFVKVAGFSDERVRDVLEKLEKGHAGWENLVEILQDRIKDDRRITRNARHEAAVKTAMSKVKPEPKGFHKWIEELKLQALIMEPFKGKKLTTAQCTVCGAEDMFEKGTIRRGMKVSCPSCGKVLDVYGTSRLPHKEEHICLIQKYDDRLIERFFTLYSSIKTNTDGGYRETGSLCEYIRVLWKPRGEYGYKRYYHRDYGWDDKNVGGFFCNYYGEKMFAVRRSRLYPGNLGKVLTPDIMATGIGRLAKDGKKFVPEDVVAAAYKSRFSAQCFNAGLLKLGEEKGPYYRAETLETVEETTGCTKAQLCVIRDNDLNGRETEWFLNGASVGSAKFFSKAWISRDMVSGLHEHMSYDEIMCLLKGLCDPYRMAKKIIESPGFEILLKAGARALAEDIEVGDIARDKSFPESIGITKGQFRRLKALNGGKDVLKWLQHENACGKAIKDTDIKWFCGNGILPSDISSIPERISLVQIRNYLEKQRKLQEEQRKISKYYQLKPFNKYILSTWCDYLDMAEKMHADLSVDLVLKPKDLKAAHDIYAAAWKSEKREKEILEKFPQINGVLQGLKRYGYSGDGCCMVIPDSVKDIVIEGNVLGHCLASTDRYLDRIVHGESYIAFIRRDDSPEKPWYSAEFEPDGTVRQLRTYGDRQDESFGEVKKFVRKWQIHLARTVLTDKDGILQKKSERLRNEEFAELRKNGSKVFHGPLAGKFLADVLERDLMPAQ